ncbi:hypothetical protein D3C79_1039680 [compost metagenome]
MLVELLVANLVILRLGKRFALPFHIEEGMHRQRSPFALLPHRQQHFVVHSPLRIIQALTGL